METLSRYERRKQLREAQKFRILKPREPKKEFKNEKRDFSLYLVVPDILFVLFIFVIVGTFYYCFIHEQRENKELYKVEKSYETITYKTINVER